MKIGTIGTSAIANEFVEAISLVSDATLHAVFALTSEEAKTFADVHGAPKYYFDLNEMARTSGIDIIYIASPNVFHVEQALLFMEQGIHALIEKPIALTDNDFERLKKAAKENNCFFMEAMRPMHHPHVELIEKELSSLGEVKHVYFNFMNYSSKYDKYKQGEITSAFSTETGGGALYDLGVYPLTVAYRLFGKPSSYSIDSVRLKSGVDGISTIILRYDGFNCMISVSKISTSFNDNEIHTDTETMLVNHITQLKRIEIRHKDVSRIVVDQLLENDMTYELRDFIEIIKNNDSQRFDYYANVSQTIVRVIEDLKRKSEN
jgi:predicted dehydrogenase